MWTPLLVVGLCFLLSHLLSQVHRRKQLEVESAMGDSVSTKKHVVDLARQSRAMVFAWWNIRCSCAADVGAGGGTEEEQGWKRIDRFVNLANLARQSHRLCLICFFLKKKSLCGQAIIAAAGRRLWRQHRSSAKRRTRSTASRNVVHHATLDVTKHRHFFLTYPEPFLQRAQTLRRSTATAEWRFG